MANDKSVPRILQQQPRRESDPQQQRAGGTDFQSRGQAQGQVEGEGSYTAARDHERSLKNYLDQADVAADGAAAKPRSSSEAREMEEAEREGKSHSKGER